MKKYILLSLTLFLYATQIQAQYHENYFPLRLGPDCNVVKHKLDKATPVNAPYHFAWKLFVEVNKQADIQWSIEISNNKVQTNNALWETWSNDPFNFPESPNPTAPPQWNQRIKFLKKTDRTGSGRAGKISTGNIDSNNVEVVFRNKATFDYIINNELWYTQGIAKFFASGQKVVFPVNSIEVKGNYVPIEESEKWQYHWNYIPNYNGTTQLMGLIAMHISSKDIPNWFWATFEHVNNPGRCDYLGCRDCFGQENHFTPSYTQGAGGIYPAETLTDPLLKLYEKEGYQGTYFDAYKQYRLKGVMVDFTDSAGVPNFLGNSVTESGFVQTSSCMGCHARAAVDANGESAFPFFGQRQAWELSQQTPFVYQAKMFTYYGNPDPNWFYSFNANGIKKIYMQTDFVWAIPFRSHPAKE